MNNKEPEGCGVNLKDPFKGYPFLISWECLITKLAMDFRVGKHVLPDA